MSPEPTLGPTVLCRRCGQTALTAQNVSYGGKLGADIRRQVCADCWQEWQRAEVMVINELRLNFMDPQAQATLIQQLRDFLCLEAD